MPPPISSGESASPGAFRGTSSARLLACARRGDSSALGQLLSRYLPSLRRWARGRLPRWARTAADTTDLIHDAVLRTIRRLGTFELRGQRALGAYLREAVQNRIRDEHRRLARHGVQRLLSEDLRDPALSPVDHVINSETEARYHAALAHLSSGDRQLIVAHMEFDYTHEQLGSMTGRTPNAARMALQRAIRRLAEHMREE